jgi:tol-pal system protein YbgF
MSALRADNHRLSAEVTDLRADHRAQDRKIKELEHELALAKAGAADAAPVPQLPVEVVGPQNAVATDVQPGQRVVGIADDGSEIIYEGDAAAGKVATIDTPPMSMPEASHHTPMSARITHARPRAVDAPAPAATSDAAGEDYRAAVELVKSGKSDEAITALHAFLQHYPRNDYADNAQYWLGEVYYAQKDYQHALAEFRATIETYPRGNKVPDALLKVGFCYASLGQADKAKAVLEQVTNLYPKTEPAALAAKRLETP